jgi:serine phosphatase RsbU (regulator of sigma subunit)
VDERAPEPAEALAGVVARLRAELAGVRRAMRNRAVIEQAKGVLVERLGIAPDAAFDQLVRLSQQTNIKLAEVAAALVGATAPDPDDPGTELIDDELRQYLARARGRRHGEAPTGADAGEQAARLPAAEGLQSQHQLLSARITAAQRAEEIAEVVGEATTGWPRPRAVLLARTEPDGTLRVLGTADPTGGDQATGGPLGGQPGGQAGALEPGLLAALSQHAKAATEARRPLWSHTTNKAAQASPDGAAELVERFATPLVTAGRTVGALAIGWTERVRLAPEVSRYLTALAGPIARRLGQLAGGPAGDPLTSALDALPVPVALLSPVRDGDGRIVDFRYDYTNGAAADEIVGLGGPGAHEQTLLTVLPDTGSRLLLGEFTRVVTEGTPCRLSDVHVGGGGDGTGRSMVLQVTADRLDDRVLVSWLASTDADLLYDQLRQAERIARIGSFWWNLRTGDARWSPELYRLFGRDPEQPAVPLSETAEFIHEEDRYAVREAIRGALLAGRAFTVEHRVADAPGRRLRMSGEPDFDAAGEVCAVRGTVQDVTEERAVESRLRRAQEALAAQRQRLTAETHAAEALQHALLPSSPELDTTVGLAVAGTCRVAQHAGRVAGDWFDAFTLPDASTVLVVGDVAGSGLPATVAASRLRNAVRAYALSGMSPARLLGAVNQMACHFHFNQLATLVVARFEPAERLLWWSAAGQAAPVRYPVDGPPTVLSGPLGLPVGAAAEVGYDETKVELGTGDRLLLYTDGLVARRGSSLADGLDVLLHAPEHTDLTDVEGFVAHVVDRLGPPEDDLCAVLAGVG